jgi:hypothetical protein
MTEGPAMNLPSLRAYLKRGLAGGHFIAGVGIPVTTLHHFQGGYEGIM